MQTSHDMIPWIPSRIVSQRHTHTQTRTCRVLAAIYSILSPPCLNLETCFFLQTVMQTSHDMITWISIWIVSHRHTHMLVFGCYIQHFVSPMLEFRDMSFLANRDANVAPYDHMDPHLDSFTETHTHMLGFGCYIQHFVSPMLEFRMGFVDKP